MGKGIRPFRQAGSNRNLKSLSGRICCPEQSVIVVYIWKYDLIFEKTYA